MIAKFPLKDRYRAVIALGGGGARGLAHLGALRAIWDSELRATRLVGTSIGSFAAALYAVRADPDPNAIEEQVVGYLTSPEFRRRLGLLNSTAPPKISDDNGLSAWYSRLKSLIWSHQLMHRMIKRPAFLSANLLEEAIERLVPDIDIADCRIPLVVVALDLLTGERVELERGNLRKAVIASSSIPGIFSPVPWGGKLLCDLGVIESLPTRTARRFDRDTMIGIDVAPDLVPLEQCGTALEVLLRVNEIGERLHREHSTPIPDLLIRPNVGATQWFDFTDPKPIIAEGFRAASKSLEYASLQR
jgi:NTE family protein